MSDKFDCPHCGQDLRLGPDAFQRLAEREKEIERLRGAIKKAVMRLGAPTMGYAPAIERRELKDSIEEASTVLLAALERRDEGEGA